MELLPESTPPFRPPLRSQAESDGAERSTSGARRHIGRTHDWANATTLFPWRQSPISNSLLCAGLLPRILFGARPRTSTDPGSPFIFGSVCAQEPPLSALFPAFIPRFLPLFAKLTQLVFFINPFIPKHFHIFQLGSFGKNTVLYKAEPLGAERCPVVRKSPDPAQLSTEGLPEPFFLCQTTAAILPPPQLRVQQKYRFPIAESDDTPHAVLPRQSPRSLLGGLTRRRRGRGVRAANRRARCSRGR